jgi:hypothetical protein
MRQTAWRFSGGLGSGRQMLRERDGPHREREEPKPMMHAAHLREREACTKALSPRGQTSKSGPWPPQHDPSFQKSRDAS